MTVVDASVWVSALAADDVNHRQSLAWMEHHLAAGGEVLAPTLVLVEVAAAMTRRTGDATVGIGAARRVRNLPELRLLPLLIADGEHAATVASERALRGADAVYVAMAQNMGVPLVTWDRQQRERASGVIDVLTPAVALARST